MAGFGLEGGEGRCSFFFREYFKCYILTEGSHQCKPQSADLSECLFHRKEKQRLEFVADEYARRKAEAYHNKVEKSH